MGAIALLTLAEAWTLATKATFAGSAISRSIDGNLGIAPGRLLCWSQDEIGSIKMFSHIRHHIRCDNHAVGNAKRGDSSILIASRVAPHPLDNVDSTGIPIGKNRKFAVWK